MAQTRRLMKREITYSAAAKDPFDMLHALSYYPQTVRFFTHLRKNLALIQEITAHHLGASPEACHVCPEVKDWRWGSFNVCIPITITTTQKRVLIRFPIPHCVGEAFWPGNADEKLRCEAGTYAWLQENCPSVPIPKLFGFALSTGQSLTATENLPRMSRYLHYLRRLILKAFTRAVPSRYIPHKGPNASGLQTGYLLIEYVEEADGLMLSQTWDNGRSDVKLRANLFRGLSKILLAMAGVPVPRIGSYIINDSGLLTLTNRPLSIEIAELEKGGIPVDIPRGVTYSSTDAYLAKTLALHDSRLYHQRNSVNNREDCIDQMSALTIMKTVASHFFKRELGHAPFVYMLSDLHRSNILVDNDWNIKCIIDLEWACARPIGMLHPPEWLTSQAVDEIDLNAYDPLRQEFMNILENEEQRLCHGIRLSKAMHQGWDMGTFWYSLALQSPTGLFTIFYEHIQPKFNASHATDPSFYSIASSYFTMGAAAFIKKKLNEKAEYDERLREEFSIQEAR
ncbi:hypothetical protein ACJ72_04226 [Emergomyces africanus]|uniref:Uncharacterized protein n=1 Tax=Emergomyces africanus TaxID=1955775 RepID=A0A1B7NXE7_9EURO|nr:hypothetical protein ACJ72_04226 [Emergomyces africanus]